MYGMIQRKKVKHSGWNASLGHFQIFNRLEVRLNNNHLSFLTTACAAASLAIGTLNGEQET